jgi:hypothetical protein
MIRYAMVCHRHGQVLAAGILVGAFLGASPAWGQAGMKVKALSAGQVAAARPFLSRGLVVLVETAPSGALSQVTLLGRVNAPQTTTYALLSDPSKLTPMQPPMRDIQVTAQKGNAITYRWRYDGTLVDIHGVTSMALAPPAAVMWIFTEGFGPGQLLWRLYPDGAETTVSLTLNVDVTKSSHTILRWLAQHNPEQPRSWNLGYGIVSLRGLQAVAAAEAGHGAFPPPVGESGHGPLRPLTAAEVSTLSPLLAAGTAGIIEQDAQGRIAQTALATRVAAPRDKVVDLLGRPASWRSPVRGVEFRLPSDDASGDRFEFVFSFPAFSVRTDMALKRRADGVDISSPSGSLKGSLVSLGAFAEGSSSVLAGAARFRPRQANFMLRRMIDADPYFGHALNASALAIWLQAFKRNAEAH